MAFQEALGNNVVPPEEISQNQDVFKVASSSLVQSQEANSVETASENMVLFVQKPDKNKTDSDEEVFTGEVQVKTQGSSATPLASEIPIAYVVSFMFINVFKCILKFVVVSVLPKTCEVNDPRLQDAWLIEKGHYANLPPLRYVFVDFFFWEGWNGNRNKR